jgi:hypothetical protein
VGSWYVQFFLIGNLCCADYCGCRFGKEAALCERDERRGDGEAEVETKDKKTVL